MPKKKRIFIFIIVILIIGLIGFFVINNFGKAKLASLEVDSNSILPVFIDAKGVGMTPYTGIYDPKLITVRLGDYETQVNLTPQVKTIIRRDFDKNMNFTSGEVVSFERIIGSDATLAVVTNPDGVEVKVDDKIVGLSPINVTLSAGTHQLEVAANGYTSASLPVNLTQGYKLTAVIDLSPSASAKASADKAAQTQELKQVMVEILTTPNGFLRVRSEPNTTSNEIAQVHPGEKYKFIKKDEKTGWYDIELTASVSGWVTDVYTALK